MSGRLLVAALLAASSASAATVGVVYTRIVAPHHVEASAVTDPEASSSGTVKSAVVLDAAESVFEPFADSTAESDTPVCPSKAEQGGCVLVSRASDIRLTILGYTVTIPPLWLGGDSEDQYSGANAGVLWLTGDPWIFEAPVLSGRRLVLGAKDDSTAQSDGGNENTNGTSNLNQSGSQSSFATGGGDGGFELSTPWPEGPASPVLLADSGGGGGKTGFFPSPFFPLDETSPPATSNGEPGPQPGASPPVDFSPPQFSNTPNQTAVPEPSTWLMMAAGLATLGLFKRRRLRVQAALNARTGGVSPPGTRALP